MNNLEAGTRLTDKTKKDIIYYRRNKNGGMDMTKISDAEYEVMKIIWKYSPINTNDVTEKLLATTAWTPETIHTLLNRLVKKKAITYSKESRVFVYTPLITQKEYLEHKSSTFLRQYFDGNLSALMANYMHSEKISDEQLKALKKLFTSPEERGK
ncbi:BlaI/MecI/CopY family transcriptional regulator [Lacrimispora sp. BS-2]|uniref:BlaI/MecI/CopY family transcriptional regulator n=1 Tax=Lacrimispora sp. BS-2 TaxID=3151850 RepID=A0AAU7PMQ1_9FIRM